MLGAELTRRLVAEGQRVRILRRSTSSLDLLGETARAVEHVVADVTDPTSLAPAFTGIERVYHAAAYVSFEGKRDRAKLRAVNERGTANVVNAALEANVSQLAHVSSMAAFGRPRRPQGMIDEATRWTDSPVNSEYARSKHRAEREVQRGVAEGLDAVIVNPSLIFGRARPGQNTRAIAEAVRDEQLPGVPAGGTNVVDVRDVAAGLQRAMHRGATGERYFLGGENMSWRQIIDALAAAFEAEPPRFEVPPRLAQGAAWLSEAAAFVTRGTPFLTRETARTASRSYRYSNEKAKCDLDCSFRSFRETTRWLATELSEERDGR